MVSAAWRLWRGVLVCTYCGASWHLWWDASRGSVWYCAERGSSCGLGLCQMAPASNLTAPSPEVQQPGSMYEWQQEAAA